MAETSSDFLLPNNPDITPGPDANSAAVRRAIVSACRALAAAIFIATSANAYAAEPGTPQKEGSLVIAGGGNLPPEIRARFVELGGGKKARVVVIPTASEDADDPSKHDGFLWPALKTEVASASIFHTRDREKANDDNETKQLDDATAVWFTGGKQRDLALAYRDTRTAEKIWAVLKRGGVVGGTSAGAAIMSAPMIEGGKDDPVMGTGLGFLPGTVIDQHFIKRNRYPRLESALKSFPNHTGFGIDEGTALVVNQSRLSVIGVSTVSVLHPDGNRSSFKDGEEIDLPILTTPKNIGKR